MVTVDEELRDTHGRVNAHYTLSSFLCPQFIERWDSVRMMEFEFPDSTEEVLELA